MDTKSFNEQNFSKSRAVCEGIEREEVDSRARKAWESDSSVIDDSDILAMLEPRQMTDREREILDMWPKFEDGEPVEFGDEGLDVYGRTRRVESVKYSQSGLVFIADDLGKAWWGNDCGPIEDADIDPSKRVKRPAPADRWGRLEMDADLGPFGYCVARGIDYERGSTRSLVEAFASDIVRRAKNLAGVEE